MSRKWKIQFKKMKTQISVLNMFIGLSTLLLFSTIIYYSVSNTYVHEITSKTEKYINQSSHYISLYIDKVILAADLISTNKDSINYLTNTKNDEMLQRSLRTQINTVLEADSMIQSIVLVSKDGRILSNEEKLEMSVSDDMMEENWYTEAINNPTPSLTGARMQEFSMQNDWVISYRREIKNENNENIGILIIDLNYNFITQYIRELNLDEDGFVFIIDENKNLVYHQDYTYFTQLEKQNELTQYIDSSSSLLTIQDSIQNTNWTIIGVSYLTQLKELKQDLFNIVCISGALILLGIYLFNQLFVKRISNPIQKLTDTMQHAEQFMPASIDPNSSLEIASLVTNYNDMLLRIKDLLDRLSVSEEEKKELEIQVLMGQINPHFLYNTLDTIIWMAEFKENNQVIDLTKSLARFFRLSLSKGNNMIPLYQEIEHVSQYLFIQKQRYGDKLQYEIDIDSSLNDCLVPRILLQPIVENSIYHGIKSLDTSGTIKISANKQDKYLIIQVSDNGVGFDVNEKKKSPIAQLSGIGLDNVEKRIKHYCGNDCGLDIHSTKNEGTIVKLTLTWITKESR